MTDFRDAIEIDLKDLALYVLRKWKLLLLGAIVGTVLLGTYEGINADEQQKETIQPAHLKTISLLDVSSAIRNMSVKDKSEVDLAYEAYKQCIYLYEQLKKNDVEVSIEDRIELIKATQQLLSINTFTSDQKIYYASLFGNEDFTLDMNQSFEANTTQSKVSVIRFLALGAICGVLFIAFIYAL